jgi:L-lactate utilization protein LutB
MNNIKENLETNGFNVLLAKDKDEALLLSQEFIKNGISIGLGGSTTVIEVGLYDYLIEHKNIELFNQYEEGITMEENLNRRRKGLLSDLYITSCNAITQDGKLVNADGGGNRVAAQIFGPKKVLLLVGVNKIVEDVEAGFKRIMEVAAVKNIERINKKLVDMGREPKYHLGNIATKFTSISSDEEGRTTIIIIDEVLGY